ncbi:MAG: hypothetical protein JSV04_09885 [Candidatus Heimdallarchaeota archaeon]|nr:MAG: hypothetical protein JSV04_09885 [Candidatus Heimdallarchaeota archaeon]
MPELPEIEAISRYLNSTIVEEIISDVNTFQHTVIRTPSKREFEDLLRETKVNNVGRIGKILFFSLDKQATSVKMYIDHGLTGRLAWYLPSQKLPAKTIFSIKFTNDKTLIYHDNRLHGAIWLFSTKTGEQSEYPAIIEHYGPDILQISLKDFVDRLMKFRGEIKGILTNKKFVAGIGNAYVDEILFEAKIHPFTKRNQISEDEFRVLYEACRKILTEAVEKIYNILITTQKLDNQQFWRQQIFKIHLKGKHPCPVCDNPISTVKAKRFTNFCRKCQSSKNRYFI